jgi:MYXO-CTERM domain-containing protein
MDEVIVGICNPSGMDPVVVNDVATCDAQGTGGTSGAGGAGGAGGAAGTGGATTGGSSGDCGCDVATTSSSAPWLLILSLAGAALWLRRRRA